MTRLVAFAITFIAYLAIHIVRKPSSVLKSILHPQSDSWNPATKPGWSPFNQDVNPAVVAEHGMLVSHAGEDRAADGLFVCAEQSTENTVTFCETYVLNAVGEEEENEERFALRRVPGNVCKTFVDRSYDLPHCWVITEQQQRKLSPSNSKVPPLFAQLSAGLLPREITNGDPHLVEKAWKQRINSSSEVFLPGTSTSYAILKKMRVKPNVGDGKVLLGILDTVFLSAYTFGLFVSGWLADRVDIRLFLTCGMMGSGIASVFLGLAHRLEIHHFSYFVLVSLIAGLCQSVGWPCVVTVMSRWFPRSYPNRGVIMGAWNSHTSLGNILGSVISTASVQWGMGHEDWPLGYEVPGFICIACGALVFFVLNPNPAQETLSEQINSDSDERNGNQSLLMNNPEPDSLLADRGDRLGDSLLLPPGTGRAHEQDSQSMSAINKHDNGASSPGLLRAIMIPGVVPFACCLMFAKMGQYALLFWGPYYLQVVGFSSERAGYLCSFFDVGGLLGGIAAGWASDLLGKRRGTVALVFLVVCAPVLYSYYEITWHEGPKTQLNVWMMILVGFWVNGPVALITTAVSADLGSHPSLRGDDRLMASVAGIIDGSGSFGAAIQGVLIGVISTDSWKNVFSFLISCSLLAASLLIRVSLREKNSPIR